MPAALVSIKKGGKVVMKIATVTEGYSVGTLENTLRSIGTVPTSKESAFKLALNCEFGGKEAIVVVDHNGVHAPYSSLHTDLIKEYIDTLLDEHFLPGIGEIGQEYVRVVELS